MVEQEENMGQANPEIHFPQRLRILLLLAVIFLSTLGISVGVLVWFGQSKVEVGFTEITRNGIPAIATALEVVEASAKLEAATPALALSSDSYQLLDASLTMRTHAISLSNQLVELDRLKFALPEINQLWELHNHMTDIQDQLGALANKRRHIELRIQRFQGDIDDASDAIKRLLDKPQIESSYVAARISQLAMAARVVAIAPPLFRSHDDSLILEDRRRGFAEILHTISQETEPIADKTSHYTLQSLIDILHFAALSEEGIFSLRDEDNRIRRQIRKKTEEHHTLIYSLVETANNYVDSIKIRVERSASKAQENIVDNRENTIIFFAIFISSIILIFWFMIIRPLMRRLTRLVEQTQKVCSGKIDEFIDIEGNDEISAMSKALCVFKEAIRKSDAQGKILEKSHENIRNILANSPVAINITRIDGEPVFFNKQNLSLFGLTAEEFPSAWPDHCFTLPAQYHHIMDLILTGEIRKNLEVELIGPDNARRWALLSTEVREFEGSKSIVNWLYDITERKQAEEESHANNVFQQALLLAIPTPMFVNDFDGIISQCNKALCDKLNVHKDKILGQKIYDIFEKELAEKMIEGDIVLLKGKQSYQYDIDYLDKTQTKYSYLVQKSIIQKDDGTIGGTVTTLTDISAQKNHQEELARLASFPKDSPYPIIEIDNVNKISLCNPAAEIYVNIHHDAEKSAFLKGSANIIADMQEQSLRRQTREIEAIDSKIFMQTFVQTEDQDLTRVYAFDITDQKNAERSILENERRLRSILSVSPLGALVVDNQGNKLWNNQRLCLLLGDTLSEFQDTEIKDQNTYIKNIADCFIWDDEKNHVLDAISKNKPLRNREVELRHREGKSLWAIVTFEPVFFNNQEAMLGWFFDITDRKYSEEKLLAQSVLLQGVLDSIGQGLCAFDKDLKLIAFNDQFLEIKDFPQDYGNIGRPFEDFLQYDIERGELGEGNPDQLLQEWIDRAKSFAHFRFERDRPDGKSVEIFGGPLPNGGFVSTYTDITETKKAQKEIEQKTSLLQDAMNNMAQGLIVTDENFRILAQNHQFQKVFDLPDTVAKSDDFKDVVCFVHDRLDDPRRAEDALDTYLSPQRFEEPFSSDMYTQTNRVIEARSQPRYAGGMVATYTDVTERKRQEQEVIEAKLRAEKALKDLQEAQANLVEAEKLASLGGLVAGVAHEINTPVGIALTAASLLKTRTDEITAAFNSGKIGKTAFKNYLGIAEESSDLLLSNINRAAGLVQSFKQVAVDQASDHRRNFNILDYTNETLHSLSPKLNKHAHKVLVDGPKDIVVNGYPGAFSQIITNLIMNSLIHGFESILDGNISILFNPYMNGSQEMIEMRYSDNGAGIAEEHIKKIFDPFFTTKRGNGSSGLGLNVIFNIIHKTMGGSITVESELGVGTTFIVCFPQTSPLPNSET